MVEDADADGLPLLPPLPAGPGSRPATRTLARLVLGLRDAVLIARTESLVAMAIFHDRELIDGLAVRDGRRVAGPDALDEMEGVPLDRLTVTEVTPEVARELGSYFLPTGLAGLQAGVVVGKDFVRGLARPGQRGCVVVRAAGTLGLAFVAGGRVGLAYREDGAGGGLEAVASLLERPGATLWARLAPDPREDAAPPVDRPPPAAVPEPPPVPPRAAPPAPPAPEDALPARGPAPSALEGVVEEARRLLGPHMVRVEGLLRGAEPTPEGLRAAAESLRSRTVRLISPATMSLLADRALAALERPGAGGEA